jgi:hypothetical protein
MRKNYGLKDIFASLTGDIPTKTHVEMNRQASKKNLKPHFHKQTRGEKRRKRKLLKKQMELAKPIKPVKYSEYIKSKAWRNRRNNYYKVHKKACVICKMKGGVGLHHLTYKNLGRERDEDLVALCWVCHESYHFENGVKRDSQDSTHDFIIRKQEEEEMRELMKRIC